ncbi:MAG: TerB family tellurite resistance protein [Gammaproteobacteria bacterium]|nr:TerB family tellurite resistance protein [Gammaproteobacteria bacterium]
MLNALKSLLNTGGDVSEPSAHTLHIAAAALLLEVGRADFSLRDAELKAIAEALKRRFGFSDDETKELVDAALEQEREAISLHPFVRLINEHFSAAQKRRIIEDMWQVAYADSELDKYEEAQIRKIADLLYVPHKDFIRAKLRTVEPAGNN